MQLKSIKVDNFKSLVGFELDLAKFTCLIGLNGAGKSTVLQFIDFLGQLARGRLDDWLRDRNWSADDLSSKVGASDDKSVITFSATFVDKRDAEIIWKATFDADLLRCLRETIETASGTLRVRHGKIEVTRAAGATGGNPSSTKISFKYQGSILSQIEESELPRSIQGLKTFLVGMEALDMLTPDRLRERTRSAEGSLGRGGRQLSAFLYELGPTRRRELSTKLKKAHGQLRHIYAKSLRSGWKQFQIREQYGTSTFFTEARHINEGLLRLIAILAELETEHEFILFDEIENGINPEVVEFVVDTLVQASQQVVVTTHSPMILNYIEDDVAKDAVVYLYKTKAGETASIKFFSVPSLAKKLKVMGPGEAFVDTNLRELADEIARVNGEGA